jgi:hypothetical protein
VKWYLTQPLFIFERPGGLDFPGLALVLFGVGCMALAREKARVLAMLLAPIVLTVTASALHLYPFGHRLLLFLVPVMYLTWIPQMSLLAAV